MAYMPIVLQAWLQFSGHYYYYKMKILLLVIGNQLLLPSSTAVTPTHPDMDKPDSPGSVQNVLKSVSDITTTARLFTVSKKESNYPQCNLVGAIADSKIFKHL